ncbi:MAG TPA: hypothetical protein VK477_00610, partial [Acidobacteriota bacterium]|nr:hypothetical protein [Acidobacteriota bacterium]
MSRSEAFRSPTPVDDPARAAEVLAGADKSPGLVTRMTNSSSANTAEMEISPPSRRALMPYFTAFSTS